MTVKQELKTLVLSEIKEKDSLTNCAVYQLHS